MTTRSAERETFLTDVLTTAVEGGIGYWSKVTEYKWWDPSLEGGTAEPGKAGGGNATVSFVDFEDDDKEYTVTVDDIARAIGVIASEAELALHQSYRTRIMGASRANDAGELDALDADIVVQVAALGDVIYG